MQPKSFSCRTVDEVREEAKLAGADIPLCEDLSSLSRPLDIAGLTARNRLAIHPMEGCDGTHEGVPGELTARRYERFAVGGAGLIWFEAVAVSPEGRGNPGQLMLTPGNADSYKRLLDDMREAAVKRSGFAPIIIMQATHSGRYSKPEGSPAPLIACNNPLYEKENPISGGHIVTDEYLDSLPELYAKCARLARLAGFDGVDTKACHRYLASELLSAMTRKNSRYGGDFINRKRFLINAVSAVRSELDSGMVAAVRLNVYDGVDYPYGFGVSDGGEADLSEPLALVEELGAMGVRLVNVTAGNPYVNPHVNRPFDKGPYNPPEHPLKSVGRMLSFAREVKGVFPLGAVVATGFSYLRQFSPHAAAGIVGSGAADLAGFGRMGFANPGFAGEILRDGTLSSGKCCVACGKCSELMRAGSTAGCVVRDGVYTEIYKRDVADKS